MNGHYSLDKEVDSAIIRLLDALCEFERNSGRRSTLILIPHNPDENVLVAQDGKPLQQIPLIIGVKGILDLALKERDQNQ